MLQNLSNQDFLTHNFADPITTAIATTVISLPPVVHHSLLSHFSSYSSLQVNHYGNPRLGAPYCCRLRHGHPPIYEPRHLHVKYALCLFDSLQIQTTFCRDHEQNRHRFQSFRCRVDARF